MASDFGLIEEISDEELSAASGGEGGPHYHCDICEMDIPGFPAPHKFMFSSEDANSFNSCETCYQAHVNDYVWLR